MAALAAELGLVAPTGTDRIRVYWLDPDGFTERSGCRVGVMGCAKERSFFTRNVPANHEFVHIFAARVGRPGAFFNEGLAVALEGLASTDDLDDRYSRSVAVDDLLDLPGSEQLLNARYGYNTAGGFTAHLLERYGMNAYLRIYAALRAGDDRAALDAVFVAELGVSLAEAADEFEATKWGCRHAAYDAKLVECSAPELTWDGDVLALHRSVACDLEDVVGPYAGDHTVVFRTFVVPEAGEYALSVIGDDANNEVSLRPCGGCEAGEGVQMRAGEAGRSVELAAGRYVLRLFGRASADTSVGFRLARE
ncbi:hypothetical protein OV079_45070 [Nannocystis pusilla]|uniref:Uncharacterized protein n=1 Tax=Nannocystis pusilla TaxID=889268 RepID=A0A9X3F6K8_9BACT|nr:hypothetical protein [Nannocystis pusilla]MCY1012588.1 hypothetical protein [Nannocystis pusilla]